MGRVRTSIQFSFQPLDPTSRPTQSINPHGIHPVHLYSLTTFLQDSRYFYSVSHHLISEINSKGRTSGRRSVKFARGVRGRNSAGDGHLQDHALQKYVLRFEREGILTKTSSDGPSRRGPRWPDICHARAYCDMKVLKSSRWSILSTAAFNAGPTTFSSARSFRRVEPARTVLSDEG